MTFRFGVFELDEDAGELRKAGAPVEIQPKPFALLAFLIRARNRVVPTDELLEELWPDTVVSSGSLTRAVSHARRAIDDTGRGEIVRSVSRRGYRFFADVVEIGGEAPTPAPPTALASDERFVGRDEAWQQLETIWNQVMAGEGRIALITGPAGIGKTRLAERFVAALAARGALTLVSRCRDRDGVPAFWVWGQALRRMAEDPTLQTIMRPLANSPELAALVPELGAPADSSVALVPDELQRFRFYDTVTRILHACARQRPLVLLLEDVHWATSASLRLLEHLAAELGDAPLFVLATVRDEPRETSHPIELTLAALRREPLSHEIALTGLSRGDVASLLAQAIGGPAPADLVSELFARTDGNPFFITEAIRLLDERGDLRDPARLPRRGVSLPASASDLIRRPLEALSEATAALLGAAAVVGREFTLSQVAAVAGVDRGDALDRLDEAIDAGIVVEQTDSVASYRFTHALFQEAIYDRLKTGARAKLHARAAARLEAQHGDALEPVLSELAHHYHRGIAVCDPLRAFEIATQAAQSALRQFAYEQAATHYEQAAANLDHCENVEASRRLVTLLALGDAHRLSGDRERRREAYLRAMQQARALGSTRDFARAAIGFCAVSEWSPYDAAARKHVEEALSGLEEASLPESARLRARLAYLDVQDRARAEPLAREAVEIARESGNADAIQEAIYVLHYVTLGPDGIAERAARIAELFDASMQCNSRDVGLIGVLDVACEALATGDRATADALRKRADELVVGYPSPSMQWHVSVFDSGLAQLEGRFDDMRRLAHETLEIGRRIGHPYAQAVFDGQNAIADRFAGEIDASIARVAEAARARRGATQWVKAFVGRQELQRGDRDAALAYFRELVDDDYAGPRNLRWTATIAETAHLCADLGEDEHAPAILDLLATAADLHGIMPMVINYTGPLRHAAARLEQRLGRVDDALASYAEALAAARDLGAQPAAAAIAFEYAELLARSGDRAAAREHLQTARAAAASLGFTALEQRIAASALLR